MADRTSTSRMAGALCDVLNSAPKLHAALEEGEPGVKQARLLPTSAIQPASRTLLLTLENGQKFTVRVSEA